MHQVKKLLKKYIELKVYSGISKTSNPYGQLLNLLDKTNLKRSDKYIALSNLIIYYTWINVKKSNKNNTFRISGPTWNEKNETPDGSYSASDIHD